MSYFHDPNMHNRIDNAAAKHRNAIREAQRRRRLGIPDSKPPWLERLIVTVGLLLLLLLVGGLVSMLLF